MGFMAGFGSGFADSFSQGQKEQAALKQTMLEHAYDSWSKNQSLYQKAKAADDGYVRNAKGLVKMLPGNVPVNAWKNAYDMLSSGMSADQVFKQLQTMKFSDPTTDGTTAPTAPTATDNMDSQMQDSGLKPPQPASAQPSIDPQFQQNPVRTDPVSDPTTMQQTPIDHPASQPIGSTSMPATETNDVNTHPATSNLGNPPADQNNGQLTLPNNPNVGENPLQTFGDRLKLGAQAIFDPNARHQLQEQQRQDQIARANQYIQQVTGLPQDEIDKITAGFVPDHPEQEVQYTTANSNGSLDAKGLEKVSARTQTAREKLDAAKVAVINLANTAKSLDDHAKANPKVLTLAGRGASGVQSMANEVSSVIDLVGSFIKGHPDATLDEVNGTFLGNLNDKVEGGLGSLANDYRQFMGEAINFAYAAAKSSGNNGTGLSDKDFANAMKSILISNDYKTFSDALRHRVQLQVENVNNAAKGLTNTPEGQMLVDSGGKYSDSYKQQMAPLNEDQRYSNDPSLYYAGTTAEFERGASNWMNGGKESIDQAKLFGATPIGQPGPITKANIEGLRKFRDVPDSAIGKLYRTYRLPDGNYRVDIPDLD